MTAMPLRRVAKRNAIVTWPADLAAPPRKGYRVRLRLLGADGMPLIGLAGELAPYRGIVLADPVGVDVLVYLAEAGDADLIRARGAELTEPVSPPPEAERTVRLPLDLFLRRYWPKPTGWRP